MVEYTIDDIRGPTVAREMAQLKEFVLAKFNGAISDAEAAAAAAATAAANAVLANTVKKTGEASQSIAGDVAITGALDAAAIGSGSTPIVCGDLTAYGNVSLDDTVLQGNLSGADSSALINLSGVGSVLVPDSTLGSYSSKDAVNAPRLKNELDNYAPMVRTTGNQTIGAYKNNMDMGVANIAIGGNTDRWIRVAYSTIADGSLYGYVLPDKNVSTVMACEFFIIMRSSSAVFKVRETINANIDTSIFAVTYDGTNYELWYHYNENSTNRRCTVAIRAANASRPFILDGETTKATLDPADYTYIVNPTVIS